MHGSREEPDTELLQRADAALSRGEADEALGHIDRHATAFPSSARADDRLVLRIRALCALGRSAEAETMVDDLRRARPEAAVLDRLGQTCVAG